MIASRLLRPVRCLGLFLVLLPLTAGVRPAGATHFYGGATSWERIFPDPAPSTQRIQFTLDAEWRWSFCCWSTPNPPVGQVLTGIHSVTGLGAAGWSANTTLDGTVTTVQAAVDRMTTTSVLTLDVPSSAFPITLDIAGCCRISALAERNNDVNYRVSTVINTANATRSPRYTGPFRVSVFEAEPMSFDLPTTAFGGLTNVTAIAPASASQLAFARPVGTAACAASGCDCYNTNAGQCANALSVTPPNHLSWTPQVGGLYAVQFAVTGFDVSGVPRTSIPVDMIIAASGRRCAAGSYSASGLEPCTPCPGGTFANALGLTACTPCTTCAADEYPTSSCSAVADAACGACDASCTSCDGPTASDCTSCPSGDAPVDGMCLADLCAAGSSSATGREPCTLCPAGSVATAVGQTACTPCAAGRTAAADGQSACDPCPPGSVADGPGRTTCDPCPAGTVAAGTGLTACAPCTTCGTGFESSSCTASQDTVCGTCDASCTTCNGPTPADCTSCPTGEAPVAGVCGPGCSLAPASGCRLPTAGGKSKLDIKDLADDAKDGLKWKWLKGSADLADFANPVTTDDWFLCIYDGTARVSTTALPAGGSCNGKPCWAAKSTGFGYKDPALTPDGVSTATLKAGIAGKASIGIAAKGTDLETPDPSAFTGPVRVQFQRGDGAVCFETVFSPPFKKNAAGTFSDLDDVGVPTTTTTLP